MHRFRLQLVFVLAYFLAACTGRSTVEPCGNSPTPLEAPKPVYMAVATEPVQAFAKFEFTIQKSGDVTDIYLVSTGTKPFHSKIEKDFSDAAMEVMKKRKYPMSDISCHAESTIWLGRPFDDA